MESARSTQSQAREPGYAIGVALIAFLVVPQVLAIAGVVDVQRCGSGDIMTGIYIIGIGTMFLASYYWSHKTFVLRGFVWICEHFSHPPGRKTAFFYFALCAFVGFLALLEGFGLIDHRYAC
jgi:hypothetical protein